jgi:protein gp37
MGLNISKGDMYSWVTHTWNTVKGACPHGCTYCYMRRFGEQKPVHFDRKELKTDLGIDNFIFVGSSCDLFAEGIPREWAGETLRHCEKYPSRYLFQSKDPLRMGSFPELYGIARAICTTIETNRWYSEIMAHSPSLEDRADGMGMLDKFDRFVTIEPIIDFDLIPLVELIKRCEPKQVNIGADSGNNHLPEPSRDKVLALIDELRKFTIIANKRNLTRIIGEVK